MNDDRAKTKEEPQTTNRQNIEMKAKWPSGISKFKQKTILQKGNSSETPRDIRRDALKKLGKSAKVKIDSPNARPTVITRNTSRNIEASEKLDNSPQNTSDQSDMLCKIHKIMPSEGAFIVQIIDSGCGMTENEMANLFKPYSQANSKVYSEYGGTGLGLWISQQLIKAMHGTIKCQSIPGKGTTFTIEIPVKCKEQDLNNVFFFTYFK